MDRKKSISTALWLAAAFFAAKFVLDMVILCCEPLQSLSRKLYYGDILKNQKLSAASIIFSAAILIIALLPKFILVIYNLSQKDLQKQRGLITIILTAAFSVLSSVISVISTPIIHTLTSSNETFLLSTLSHSRAVTGLFSSAATIILYCCGAIELYCGTEKTTYPPYNGEINNNENNLS